MKITEHSSLDQELLQKNQAFIAEHKARQVNSEKVFAVIAGNIGSGKTTLTQKLSQDFGWNSYFESVSDNPYLADFYEDMGKWSFQLQIFFLTHRFNTHLFIENSNASSIQDRSIYEDAMIFARALYEQGSMSSRDYENYLRLYESITPYLNPPSILIYLRRSVPKLLERIKKRGRDFEAAMPADYLARLNAYYEDWIQNYKLGKVIIIDTDDLDFMENPQDYANLVKRIQDETSQTSMFEPVISN